MSDDAYAELCPACTRISWDIQDGECRTCRATPDHPDHDLEETR